MLLWQLYQNVSSLSSIKSKRCCTNWISITRFVALVEVGSSLLTSILRREYVFRDHIRKGDHLPLWKVSPNVANPFPTCSKKLSSQGWTELLEGKILPTPRHWQYTLTSIPTLLVQRRLRWFGHAARRLESELIKNLLLPTPQVEQTN